MLERLRMLLSNEVMLSINETVLTRQAMGRVNRPHEENVNFKATIYDSGKGSRG